MGDKQARICVRRSGNVLDLVRVSNSFRQTTPNENSTYHKGDLKHEIY